MSSFTVTNENELDKVAEFICKHHLHNKLFLFYGEVGAGKTTLIKKICKYLKIEDEVTSPTFSIVNKYIYANNDVISHFDFYRFKNIDEVYNIGVYEYIDNSKFCFFEWPEVANEIFTNKYLKIFIKVNNSKRIINIV
ncbi:tRNA (adenosine(37)-N6)-threonylcarbamoyltransferase complex ATPase subunit type 1 TsaE [Bacteroidota bacterium]|nr:tRNA (adenosine(37)-N6)-threonylcarbamoyltransferase complex ATPase subunit type 1 TsaE [Bacteroidota bacterium]